MSFSRRRCIGLLAASPLAAAAGSAFSLSNEAIELSLTFGAGRLVQRRVRNRLAGETADLPAEDFALELEPGGVVRSSACACRVVRAGRESIELRYSGGGVETSVVYSLASGKAYLRKQIRLRRAGGSGAVRLLRAELEDWRGVRRAWQSKNADALPYGSHPISCQTWWAGVEFVAAANSHGPGGFVLASRPGAVPLGAEWLRLRSTVVGAARPGEARDSFLAYIEDIRRAPPRMVTCYNSWWTLPKVVLQRDNLALIRELKAALYDAHGVFFDIITTDMGWSDPRSIWQIDRKVLPQGFDDIRPIVESAGGKLGLWMSPSELYPPVCDYEWAEKNGYTVIRQKSYPKPGISLADPRYREETKIQLKRLIREAGLKHIKYDGFIAEEEKPHHGMRAGADSVEPLAAYSLELLEASKEADPELVTEPTYLNSHYWYISPWILKYSDTVWANAGGDYPPGLTPAPVYREAQTSAREYFIFSALDEVWLPQNAVQHFDIVHVDDREGFANHAAMAFGRGRFFVPAYINPRLMAQDDWRVLAGLIRWAKANRELLLHTVEMPGRVELGEPYAYAHWQGARGVIAIRNPSNGNREYVLDLKRARAPETLRDGVCYTQYPYRRGIAGGLDSRSTLRLALAPWELLFLEIVPRASLAEPVAIGARWIRDASGGMQLSPDAQAGAVRVLLPGGGERPLSGAAPRRQALQGELTGYCVRRAPEERWLAALARRPAVIAFRYPVDPASDAMRAIREQDEQQAARRKVTTVEFEVSCTVKVPADVANAQVLLLVQFPGRDFRPSRCAARLDGRPVELCTRDTDQHIGFFMARPNNAWRDLLPFESHWCWYICDVSAGVHELRFTGMAGHQSPKLGLWLWTERSRHATLAAGVACPEPAMPQVRPEVEREGICLRDPLTC